MSLCNGGGGWGLCDISVVTYGFVLSFLFGNESWVITVKPQVIEWAILLYFGRAGGSGGGRGGGTCLGYVSVRVLFVVLFFSYPPGACFFVSDNTYQARRLAGCVCS